MFAWNSPFGIDHGRLYKIGLKLAITQLNLTCVQNASVSLPWMTIQVKTTIQGKVRTTEVTFPDGSTRKTVIDTATGFTEVTDGTAPIDISHPDDRPKAPQSQQGGGGGGNAVVAAATTNSAGRPAMKPPPPPPAARAAKKGGKTSPAGKGKLVLQGRRHLTGI